LRGQAFHGTPPTMICAVVGRSPIYVTGQPGIHVAR